MSVGADAPPLMRAAALRAPSASLSALIAALERAPLSPAAAAALLTRALLTARIALTGRYSCANRLAPRRATARATPPAIICADSYFPYCSCRRRLTTGVEYSCCSACDGGGGAAVTFVHLQRDAPPLLLEAHRVYLVGAERPQRALHAAAHHSARLCLVCGTAHDIRRTSCAIILRFFAVGAAAAGLQKRIDTRAPGARILSIHPHRPSVLRDCSLHTHLCARCAAAARRAGDVWFRLNGRCRRHLCPNHSRCDCRRRHQGCADYAFVSEGFRHNLPRDALADAVRAGAVVAMPCALYNRRNVELLLRWLYAALTARVRARGAAAAAVDGRRVAAWAGLRVEELAALCMHERRLADFMAAGAKSFALSVVNGFVALGPCRAGPWLDGRLVWDAHGRAWHVGAAARRVVVHTARGVSVVRPVPAAAGGGDGDGDGNGNGDGDGNGDGSAAHPPSPPLGVFVA